MNEIKIIKMIVIIYIYYYIMLLIIYTKISNKHYLKNNRTHSFRKSLSNTTKNLKSRECTKKSNPSECNFKNSGSLQRIEH